jgi:hypothetical protein
MASIDPHQRIDAMHTRVAALEQWAEGFKLQMNDAVNEIQANTRLTEEIHSNTHELIETMADLKALGRWGRRAATASKYAASFVALIASVWALLHNR